MKNTTGGDATFGYTASPSPLANCSITTSGGTGGGPGAANCFFDNIVIFQNYTINENTIPAGWSFDSASCPVTSPNNGSATPGQTTTINMAEGENWTCTYNNSRDTGSIELRKHWVGHRRHVTINIGTAAGGSQVATRRPTAWTHHGSKPSTPARTSCPRPIRARTTPPRVLVRATARRLSPGASNSVSVGTNDVVVCTFTNTRNQGSIELRKHWVGTAGTVTIKIGTAAGW